MTKKVIVKKDLSSVSIQSECHRYGMRFYKDYIINRIMEKSEQIDKKISEITIKLGMPKKALQRLATIEYLKNHFQIQVNSEVQPELA